MNTRTQGIMGVCIAQTVLGTIGACVVESGADSASVAFYRCLFGAAVLALYCYWRGDLAGITQLSRRTLLLALLSGVLMVANWVLFFEGLQRAGIAVATILFHIQPFFVVLLGAVFFRERLQGMTFLWFAIALTGLCLATGLQPGEFATGVLGTDPAYTIGIACTLAASLLYAFVTVIAKALAREGTAVMKAPQLTLLQCLCGAVLLVPLSPLGAALAPGDLTAAQWGWLALIGIVHTGGMYVLLYGALPKLTTPVIAALLFLYPASAVIVDAVIYGRLLDLTQIMGLGFIFLAGLGVTLKCGFRGKRAALPA